MSSIKNYSTPVLLAPVKLLGISLVLFFILQQFFAMAWPQLTELQSIESYKRWTGVGLLGIILAQWGLSLSRYLQLSPKTLHKVLLWHEWVGAFAPIVFFLHSTHLGIAFYLIILSSLFITNTIIGLFLRSSRQFFGNNVRLFLLFLHIIASIAVLFLSLLHVGVVFYYE